MYYKRLTNCFFFLGKVVIQGLYAEEKYEYEHSRPVTSVALDPMFSKTKKPRFVTGGKSVQLMMTTKGN